MRVVLEGVRERLRALQAADPQRRRFGADVHGYELRAPIDGGRLAAIERTIGTTLPGPYRDFVATIGEGAAGPGYGLSRLDHPCQLEGAARPFPQRGPLAHPHGVGDDDPYWSPRHLDGTILLADHGCGYTSVLVVAPGEAHGRVWADVRGAGLGLLPTHDDFAAWYHEWLRDTLADPPRSLGLAPSSSCAPPNALGSYLAHFEEERGVAAGHLPEDAVRDALSGIGEGGIATRCGANERFFADGDPVRPCINCTAMVDRFVGRDMMRWSQLLPGLPPWPDREAS
jgi:hypothetical protein